jgi:hypothetical protein
VASNVLGPRLRLGRLSETDLAAVQRRREWPVRIFQVYQRVVQGWFMATRPGAAADRVPFGLRAKARIPFLRDLTARIFGLGV